MSVIHSEDGREVPGPLVAALIYALDKLGGSIEFSYPQVGEIVDRRECELLVDDEPNGDGVYRASLNDGVPM